jgi:hypothetical protein
VGRPVCEGMLAIKYQTTTSSVVRAKQQSTILFYNGCAIKPSSASNKNLWCEIFCSWTLFTLRSK